MLERVLKLVYLHEDAAHDRYIRDDNCSIDEQAASARII